MFNISSRASPPAASVRTAHRKGARVAHLRTKNQARQTTRRGSQAQRPHSRTLGPLDARRRFFATQTSKMAASTAVTARAFAAASQRAFSRRDSSGCVFRAQISAFRAIRAHRAPSTAGSAPPRNPTLRSRFSRPPVPRPDTSRRAAAPSSARAPTAARWSLPSPCPVGTPTDPTARAPTPPFRTQSPNPRRSPRSRRRRWPPWPSGRKPRRA